MVHKEKEKEILTDEGHEIKQTAAESEEITEKVAESEEIKQETAGPEAAEEENTKALLEAKIKEFEDLFGRFQRLQADFENYKRRSRKDLEEMAKYGAERVILGLLPVLDNFSRALNAVPKGSEAEKFMSGMDMIYRQCLDVLEAEGLKAIEALNQPFDPEKHDAVMSVEAESVEEDNLITEELQVGYALHGKVIRPSMVKVAKYNGS